jgi:YbbR domain-containing protein
MDFRSLTEKIALDEVRWEVIKQWLRGLVTEDWPMKLIALLIALVLWFGVSGQRTMSTSRIRGVHLSFRVPSGAEISNDPVQEVEITVTGDKRNIDRINKNDLTVTVDLSNYKPSELVVPLKPETVSVELPNSVKLDEIQPNKIVLRLEKSEEELVEVRPSFEGQLPEGYEIYSTTVVPARARIRGPESYVSLIDRVPTERINLDGHKEDFVARQISVNPVNPKVTFLDAVVDVSIKIGEQRMEKTIINLPVKDELTGKTAKETASVVLYGPRTAIEKVKADNFQIMLVTDSGGKLVPTLVWQPNFTPEGIEVRSVKPENYTLPK